MGGYQRPPLRLEWPDDSEYDGFVVRMRRMPIGVYLSEKVLSRSVIGMLGDADHEAEAGIGDLEDLVSRYLVSWNLLDDDGEPVGTDVASLHGQDPVLLDDIARAWVRASVGVSRPLPRPSADGSPYPEESIPMEPLSANPESLPTPA